MRFKQSVKQIGVRKALESCGMGVHFGGRWVGADNFKPEHINLFGFNLNYKHVDSNGFCQREVFFWMKEDLRKPWRTATNRNLSVPRHDMSLTYKIKYTHNVLTSQITTLNNET